MRFGDRDLASRVSSSTVPISRMYMRTGSVVRPNSAFQVGQRRRPLPRRLPRRRPWFGLARSSGRPGPSYTGMPMSPIIEHDVPDLPARSRSISSQVVVDLGAWCSALPRFARLSTMPSSPWRRLLTLFVDWSRPAWQHRPRFLREGDLARGLAGWWRPRALAGEVRSRPAWMPSDGRRRRPASSAVCGSPPWRPGPTSGRSRPCRGRRLSGPPDLRPW